MDGEGRVGNLRAGLVATEEAVCASLDLPAPIFVFNGGRAGGGGLEGLRSFRRLRCFLEVDLSFEEHHSDVIDHWTSNSKISAFRPSRDSGTL
jgi:hypothetical protein